MLSGKNTAAVLLSERLSLTAFFAGVTRDFHQAEDVFQEVCVKAVGRCEEFESAQHLVNWARVAGRNRAIDLIRSRDGRYEGLSEEMLETLSSEWPPKAQADSHHEALMQCVEQLTPNNREILRLRYYEGLSGAAVAAEMRRKLETVYQALARIHKALADCVNKRMHLDSSL